MSTDEKFDVTDSQQLWTQTLRSLQGLGFSALLCGHITRILAAILHLGNVNFSNDDATTVLDLNQFHFAADLLKVMKACISYIMGAKITERDENDMKTSPHGVFTIL